MHCTRRLSLGWTLTLVAFLAVATLVPAAAFAGETEWKRTIDAGDAAARKGDFPVAAQAFEAALKDAEGWSPKGQAVEIHERTQGAEHPSNGRLTPVAIVRGGRTVESLQ